MGCLVDNQYTLATFAADMIFICVKFADKTKISKQFFSVYKLYGGKDESKWKEDGWKI